jgi:ribosome assembly protein YihI (activator of Der GTPase)
VVRGRVRLIAGDGEEDDDQFRPGRDPRVGSKPLVVLEVEHATQTAFQVC